MAPNMMPTSPHLFALPFISLVVFPFCLSLFYPFHLLVSLIILYVPLFLLIYYHSYHPLILYTVDLQNDKLRAMELAVKPEMWFFYFQMSDANEGIVKLQNRVAELEEDKGNLQLHLVDFDELKGKNKKFQNKILFSILLHH